MPLHLLRSSIRQLPRRLAGARGIQTITMPNTPNVANEASVPAPKDVAESIEAAEKARLMQAPNRATTWSKSQRPRALGMTGPRFEQTDLTMQPAPWAAIELIHQQPVRWSEKRVVECNGGGGPAGHPKIYINVDKPEVAPCGYCGLPYAHIKHKKYLHEHGADYPLE
ncbi:hypothetical protein FN846DRAFT_367055 [Sphaerosporella brunnea]|uniref:Zinc finger CHCC-type domain-containing protein n=1 Tax=Sphaerosporella brunnea TaxID=1250544 RepID=A0A5J5EI63_9PEZI|nr:hypothetical protein FN846DRAFT_367055 [Sphaerosporella brunnea]